MITTNHRHCRKTQLRLAAVFLGAALVMQLSILRAGDLTITGGAGGSMHNGGSGGLGNGGQGGYVKDEDSSTWAAGGGGGGCRDDTGTVDGTSGAPGSIAGGGPGGTQGGAKSLSE